MPTKILLDGEYAVALSTFFVDLTFRDETDQEKAPDSATWTLKDEDGAVVNSREDEEISSPTSEETIVLSGDDLALPAGFTGKSENRVFIVSAVYDSDDLADAPLIDSLVFPVVNPEYID